MLWARPANRTVSDRLLAAIDAEGLRHLLVRLEPDEDPITDNHSRGLTAATREFEFPPFPSARFVDLVCHDPVGYAAFDLIGAELLGELAARNQPAPRCVELIIGRWRRFWGSFPRQLLTREEQLGLFSEIWFLAFWLIPYLAPIDAVDRWRGPLGSRHDFEWLGHSVEVKATSAVARRVHRIHGLEQLDPPREGQLFLYSVQLREEGGATNSLPTLIAACRQLLARDANALSRFEDLLLSARYNTAHETMYASLRLRVVSERLYAVRDAFPRLTLADLAVGLPAGVDSVNYEIDLAAADPFVLARAPGDIWPRG